MKITALLALAGILTASPAAAQSCLTPPEAESIALIAIPDVIRQTGVVCAARLPATSLIRQPGGALLARYDREADRAWPAAKAAIAKLSVPEAALLLQSDYARPVLTTLIAPLLVGRIALEDCGTIDRLVTLLEPLPPRNVAGIVVAALLHLRSEKARGKAATVPDLPLCPVR